VSLLRKGTVLRRGGLPAFKPTGLVPQQVVDVNRSDPTANTYQRKAFYDGTNFFIIYHDYVSETGYRPIKYSASADGISWITPVVLRANVVVYAGGHIDVNYPNRGALDGAGNPLDASIYYTTSTACTWRPYVISGQTLTEGSSLGSGQVNPQGGTIVSSLNGDYEYLICHRDATYEYVRTIKEPDNVYDDSVALSWGSTTTGGNQLLPYKTSSPYEMLVLCKGGDNKLYYNTVDEPTATFAGSFAEVATLGTGFNDFCATSEAMSEGDPEIIHVVYIKSSGELCYRKFESDAWGTEKVLVTSGATYPVIACGASGKLYVFYVADGKVWVIHFNGSRWFKSVELFTASHTYASPAYLSSNQNVQDGLVCLVWTEGTASPYEVWFCYLED